MIGAAIGRAGRSPALPLTLIVVLGSAFLGYYSLQSAVWQPDELLHVELGRWAWDAPPASLWNLDVYQRGLQTLYVWAIGLPLGVLESPWDLRAVHLLSVVAYASAAIPAYLLARELALPRGVGYLVAALTVAVPWAVVATAIMTETIAYPLFVWSIWAIVRAAAAPSARRDALAILLVGLTALGRVSLAVLVVPLIAVPFLQELRLPRRGGGTFVSRLRSSPVAMWRSHPLLTSTLIVGASLSLVGAWLLGEGSTDDLTGTYPGAPIVDLGYVLRRFGEEVVRFTLGVGVVPVLVAVPWLLRELWRPSGRHAHAAASTFGLAALLVLYATTPAGLDERYVIYLAPLAFVGMAMGLWAARPPTAGPVVTALLFVWLLVRTDWPPFRDVYDFFAYPAQTFYVRAVVQGIPERIGGLDGQAVAIGGILVLAVAATVACLGRGTYSVRIRTALAAFVLAVCIVQAVYAVSEFVEGTAGVAGVQTLSIDDRAAVNEATGGEPAGLLATQRSADFAPIWTDIRHWNSSVNLIASIEQPPSYPTPIGFHTLTLDLDPRTGRLSPGARVPEFLAVPRLFLRIPVSGRTVARLGHLPVDVIRVDRPVRARWRATGIAHDGWLRADRPASVRVYRTSSAARRPSCLRLTVAGPEEIAGSRRFRIAAERADRRAGAVDAGETRSVELPLRFGRSPHVDLTIEAAGATRLPDGRRVSVPVALAVVGCR